MSWDTAVVLSRPKHLCPREVNHGFLCLASQSSLTGAGQGPCHVPPGTGHCDHSLPGASKQGKLWRGPLAS